MKRTTAATYSSSGPEDTADIARRLARELPPGSVVALVGPLGSGKTVFVKGMAEALGLPAAAATSPTFTLINEYDGSPPLYHIDLYRLERPEEAAELGLHEYFDGNGIVAVEWAERASGLLPERTITVGFERTSDGGRRITVSRV
jgi:tRNA threonylcarbamoyladenosine biosynthesis protein TsaE